MTASRRLIVETMLAGAHHLTAADIVESVRRADPYFHESTVYRTLERLTELGVVQPVQLAPGAAVFHLVEPAGHHHHHLVCEECGAVIEADAGLLDELADEIDGRYGFSLRTDAATLHGRCAACQ